MTTTKTEERCRAVTTKMITYAADRVGGCYLPVNHPGEHRHDRDEQARIIRIAREEILELQARIQELSGPPAPTPANIIDGLLNLNCTVGTVGGLFFVVYRPGTADEMDEEVVATYLDAEDCAELAQAFKEIGQQLAGCRKGKDPR